MAKQPTTGQKKSKADISKAASQKKGGHKVTSSSDSEMDQGKS
jgi:hypothetical protein